MHLIISKWLRIQNSDKRERQSDKEVEAKEDNLSESVFFHLTMQQITRVFVFSLA